jgi:hypothetical protein
VTEDGKGAALLMRERDGSRTFAALRRESFECGNRFGGNDFSPIFSRGIWTRRRWKVMRGRQLVSWIASSGFAFILKRPTAEAAAVSEV